MWEGTPADAETLLKQLQSTEAKAAATVVWFEDKLRSNQLYAQSSWYDGWQVHL